MALNFRIGLLDSHYLFCEAAGQHTTGQRGVWRSLTVSS